MICLQAEMITIRMTELIFLKRSTKKASNTQDDAIIDGKLKHCWILKFSDIDVVKFVPHKV